MLKIGAYNLTVSDHYTEQSSPTTDSACTNASAYPRSNSIGWDSSQYLFS